jgi:hypothetical protein
MWPGQQPPGDGNPQHRNPGQYPNQPPEQGGANQGSPTGPNPYQQPGYQQNPYQQPGPQQPGYPQHNPYQQPTAPQWAVPAPGQQPGPPQPSQGRGRTALVAAVAVVAVLAAAGITWALVTEDDKEPEAGGKGAPAASSPPATGKEPSGPPTDSPTAATPSGGAANPRAGEDAKPTIPGWKVVVNPKHGTVFDVPADWEVASSGMVTGFEDEKKSGGAPLVAMSAPAYFKSEWCKEDKNQDGVQETTGLGTVGTKGGKGAKDAATAAYNEAGNWAWAGYAQKEPKGRVKVVAGTPYTTASGLTGSLATATAAGVKKTSKCATDGKSFAFSFKDASGEFKSWVLYANKGVTGEIPDSTVRQILSTLRLDTAAAG